MDMKFPPSFQINNKKFTTHLLYYFNSVTMLWEEWVTRWSRWIRAVDRTFILSRHQRMAASRDVSRELRHGRSRRKPVAFQERSIKTEWDREIVGYGVAAEFSFCNASIEGKKKCAIDRNVYTSQKWNEIAVF